MGVVLHALSIKQPWAALVVAGIKSIEIRRWPTDRRGLILIHASGTEDNRREGWDAVPQRLLPLTKRRGGIIGSVELIDCVAYDTAEAFGKDRGRHLNHPDWFRPPRLFGLVFRNAQTLPFRRFPGWIKFFPVELKEAERKRLRIGDASTKRR
jgi:hypothetical protein